MARGCCPRKPVTRSALSLADSLAAQFDQIRTSQPRQLINSLGAFARNVLPDCCRVVFTPPLKKSVIESYIDILHSMAPAGMALLYRSHDGTQNPQPDPAFPASCGIPHGAVVVNITDGGADPYLPVGGLCVEPVLTGQSQTPDQKREFQEALRFVLVMAAITYGESFKGNHTAHADSTEDPSDGSGR